MTTSDLCQNAPKISMELAMNFATGYLLHLEREKVRAKTQHYIDRGETKYVVKISDWVEKNVLDEMKAYDLEQNQMETEVKEEEEESEGDEGERVQRKYIALCVRELLTDYQYEEAAMRRRLKKVADEALQVNTWMFISFINQW